MVGILFFTVFISSRSIDEISYRPPATTAKNKPNLWPITIGFSGTVRNSRAEMFRHLHDALAKHNLGMVIRPANPQWQQVMQVFYTIHITLKQHNAA